MFETNFKQILEETRCRSNSVHLSIEVKILLSKEYLVAGLSLETALRYAIRTIYLGFLHPVSNLTVTGLDCML